MMNRFCDVRSILINTNTKYIIEDKFYFYQGGFNRRYESMINVPPPSKDVDKLTMEHIYIGQNSNTHMSSILIYKAVCYSGFR